MASDHAAHGNAGCKHALRLGALFPEFNWLSTAQVVLGEDDVDVVLEGGELVAAGVGLADVSVLVFVGAVSDFFDSDVAVELLRASLR
jgi:hypothetical protein